MIKQNLIGKWTLKETGSEDVIKGRLPSCNYIDLMNSGEIPDVFYGENEKKALWVGERDWQYSRMFFVDEKLFACENIFLEMSGVDTIADIRINDNKIANVKNIHIDYKFDIKEYIKMGTNTIELFFYAPINYVKKEQKMDSYPHSLMGISGFPHIRKPAYHYGWDWGPILPPSGVNGEIAILGHPYGYIEEIKYSQTHSKNNVLLSLQVQIVENKGHNISIKVLNPLGEEILSKIQVAEESNEIFFDIPNPDLWYANGMNEQKQQPLYTVITELLFNDENSDRKSVEIGFRTIELDTKKDEFGSQFAFVVNGIRIFAKGANWIPSDSFVSRITDEKLEFHIKSCAMANMNMIRVWGGGYYESDLFYELCDKYGVLIWQDFAFACNPYPFYNAEFLENVQNEVESVVKRLRHHASLCLWCGNNEIESMSLAWRHKTRHMQSTEMFFYEVLPQQLKGLDDVTPYWAGSPSSGNYMQNVNADHEGDTHLWHVWHGLMPFEYYQKRFTRFCSEFGFESMPSMDTIKTFAEEKDYALTSKVMLSHQKCRSGNQKILYYMIDNYTIPKHFSDLVYVSQIVQAESIKAAVEHWRRHAGRCNGALFWQLNDCWPTLSWSSIDYLGRWKALQYYSKRFFEPITISVNKTKIGIKLFVINESHKTFKGKIEWKFTDFEGKDCCRGYYIISVESNEIVTKEIGIAKQHLKKYKKTGYIHALLTDSEDKEVSRNTYFFVKPRELELQKAKISAEISQNGENYDITLSSDTFTKNVCLNIENQELPFSDNFFDLEKGEKRVISFKAKGWVSGEKSLTIQCYNNVVPKYSRFAEKMIKYRIALKPMNIISKILYKFL